MEKMFHLEDLAELFTDVQTQRVFHDQKFFTDCIPVLPIDEIVKKYREQNQQPTFNLLQFLKSTFLLPQKVETAALSGNSSIIEHINSLWDKLTHKTNTVNSTLIDLPYPYVVPGGRFRELFYWDSYFTMLGLQAAGRNDLLKNVVDNFAHLIEQFGFIPNANRTYFLTRSQPPYFSLMVDLLAKDDPNIQVKYLPHLKNEYDFWMQGSSMLSDTNNAVNHVVRISEGVVLNRYWDNSDKPRPESYWEDTELGVTTLNTAQLYRNIRSACASGWDFSSRWLASASKLQSIKTTSIIPIDLNCLLWNLERRIAEICAYTGDDVTAEFFRSKAESRFYGIQKYLWNDDLKTFMDFDLERNTSSDVLNAAMVYPLFFEIATQQQAEQVKAHLADGFVQLGGLLTTLSTTGQQWDAPNGWAPLQWTAYRGLKNYGFYPLADQIANNWTKNVERVFYATGKIMEKYNVMDTTIAAGGGEYPNQDGFGWTNGVYLKMKMEMDNN
ncbi:alpha,alpha-trehalase TreF [Pedobacter sp.]